MGPFQADLEIHSLSNPQLKRLMRLRTRSKRDKESLFLIEGAHELRAALTAQVSIEACYFSEASFQKKDLAYEVLAMARQAKVPCIALAKTLFDKASLREGPDGIIALGRPWTMSLESLKPTKAAFLLLVEGVEKPGNLGALMRSAEAVGVDALILCDPIVDPLNPAVIRNSRGAIFSLPIAVASNEESYAFLKKHTILMVGTSPSAHDIYWNAPLKEPVAVLMGSEKSGLSSFWFQNVEQWVKIPLMGKADSLNLASATTLVLYEVLRQRQKS